MASCLKLLFELIQRKLYPCSIVQIDTLEIIAGNLGIRLRRDNWVSVRYAEELNSGKSSVTPQRTDRHGILGEKLTDFQVSL